MNMATAIAINETSEKNTVKSSMSITTTKSEKHETTTTHKTNVSTSISGGFNLFNLVDMSIQVQGGYEYSKAKLNGTASETEKKQEIEYEVTVPANKKVTLTVTAKQVKCDVPFSYTQRDKLLNGEIRIYNYNDGLYTSIDCYDLRYQTKEEELDSSKKRKTEEGASMGA
jgi:homoserine kinase